RAPHPAGAGLVPAPGRARRGGRGAAGARAAALVVPRAPVGGHRRRRLHPLRLLLAGVAGRADVADPDRRHPARAARAAARAGHRHHGVGEGRGDDRGARPPGGHRARRTAHGHHPGHARGRDVTGWAALDRRTVVVAALLMAGVSISAGVPTGIGIAQATSIGTALLWLLPAAALLVAGGSAVEYVRWRRTRYRLAPGRVELRTGVLVSRHRSVQRDRI